MSSKKKTVTETAPPKWHPYTVTKPAEKAPAKPMSPRVKKSTETSKP